MIMMKSISSKFTPLALLAVIFSLCISSCSNDNEDNDSLPPAEGEEEVTDTTATVAELDSAELYCTKGEQKIYGYIYKGESGRKGTRRHPLAQQFAHP